ncbi:MAG: YbhB/YbcL family Raf kinase inhibitor-like protein [Rhodospirillaceae bacterium]
MSRVGRVFAMIALAAAAGSAVPARAGDFALTSSDVAEQRFIAETHVYAGGGCAGGNLSPALQWRGAPAATRSFVVTAFDPDAPSGSGWWLWVVYNLPASTDRLARGAGDPARALLPVGAVLGRTDYGAAGYGGPCPAKGDRPHHIVFTVTALDIETLPVRPGATAAMVGLAVHSHQLAAAKLTGIYGR